MRFWAKKNRQVCKAAQRDTRQYIKTNSKFRANALYREVSSDKGPSLESSNEWPSEGSVAQDVEFSFIVSGSERTYIQVLLNAVPTLIGNVNSTYYQTRLIP